MPKSYSWFDLPNYARPFGGNMVIDRLRACGHIVSDTFDPSEKASTLLVSIYWCEAVYDWVRFAAQHGLGKRQVIIGGNHGTGSPRSLTSFCSGVYRGDADLWDGEDMTHIQTFNRTAAPCVVKEIPKVVTTMEAKAVGKVSFPVMELSRGCKYKCAYCQYAWMKPYREQSGDWLIDQVSGLKGRVRLSSADIPQHRDYDRIHAACQAAGVGVSNQDGALFTVAAETGPLGKMQRFGVDGMSERLRKEMRKPIKADWLVERIADYARRGVTRCLAYNLFGLPGETCDDYLEWDDTVRRIVSAVKPPFTWVNSWNAFLPMPMTPLESAPSSWRNDQRDLRRMAETRRWAKAKGVNLFDMPERTGNTTITMRLLAIRGTEASAHIIRTLALKPNTPERAILKEFERCEGYHLHGEYPEQKK